MPGSPYADSHLRGGAYHQRVKLLQLEAFVAVATELHFGRAAERLRIGQPALSDRIRRLETEFGTPLLNRTTRRVTLTPAGTELLTHAVAILNEVAAADVAVQRVVGGRTGTVRVGISPPAGHVLIPHLIAVFGETAPNAVVDVRRMWLPHLRKALVDQSVDVLITCGVIPDPPHGVTEVLCHEPLSVSVRRNHRLADRSGVPLSELAHERLGIAGEPLFPAWVSTQRQALQAAGVDPPMVELDDNHVSAGQWPAQPDVDWILTIGSLTDPDMDAVVLPIEPPRTIPFVLQWIPDRNADRTVESFVRAALDDSAVPPGWSATALP
jgi:DNA-binding transcriptional LysR family regulator